MTIGFSPTSSETDPMTGVGTSSNEFLARHEYLCGSSQAFRRFDLMIGCVALVHDLTLVTHNTADYRNIPDLRLVDGLAP
ncbi:MAG: type II toxin-antitoxin system VapC family toxin [Pirellulales bacterium]